MNFSFYIAKRYAASFSKTSAINFITGFASFGIIASTTSLFVVLSFFSGLKDFSIQFTSAADPDFRIMPKKGKNFFLTNEHINQLTQSKTIAAFSKIIEDKALFTFKQKEQVAYLKGVDSHFLKVCNISNYLYDKQWIEPLTGEVIVGAGISKNLSMGVLDFQNSFDVYVAKPGKGLIENPNDAYNQSSLLVMGVVSMNEDIDNKYVFCDYELAKELLGYKNNQMSYLEIKKNSSYSDDEVKDELEKIFKGNFTIKSKIQLNDSLYKMLNTENIAVYLIFTLVLIISLFNLVGALIMMIIEKKHNLKTLYSLGSELSSLKNIFFYQGNIISIVGTIIGIIIGVIIVYLQSQFAIIMIDVGTPYPVKFEFFNLVIVLITSIGLGLISSKITSSVISKKLLE